MINEKELANIIYDTLFQNTMHKQFKDIINKVDNQEVGENYITFTIGKAEYGILVRQFIAVKNK